MENHLCLGELEPEDVTSCQYLEVSCPNKCGLALARKDLEKHLKSKCKRKIFFGCEFCRFEDQDRQAQTLHRETCLFQPVSCPNGCGVAGIKRSFLSSHLEDECPLRLTSCDYDHIGCEVEFPNKDRSEHNAEYLNEHFHLMSEKVVVLDEKNQELQSLCLNLKNTCSKLEDQYSVLFSLINSNNGGMEDSSAEITGGIYLSIERQASFKRDSKADKDRSKTPILPPKTQLSKYFSSSSSKSILSIVTAPDLPPRDGLYDLVLSQTTGHLPPLPPKTPPPISPLEKIPPALQTLPGLSPKSSLPIETTLISPFKKIPPALLPNTSPILPPRSPPPILSVKKLPPKQPPAVMPKGTKLKSLTVDSSMIKLKASKANIIPIIDVEEVHLCQTKSPRKSLPDLTLDVPTSMLSGGGDALEGDNLRRRSFSFFDEYDLPLTFTKGSSTFRNDNASPSSELSKPVDAKIDEKSGTTSISPGTSRKKQPPIPLPRKSRESLGSQSSIGSENHDAGRNESNTIMEEKNKADQVSVSNKTYSDDHVYSQPIIGNRDLTNYIVTATNPVYGKRQ